MFKRFAAPTCFLLVAGGIIGTFAIVNAVEKHKQGSAAPSHLQGKAHEIMFPRKHGTCVSSVQDPLRWGADADVGDNICCFNRHYAERAGSWLTTSIVQDQQHQTEPTIFYDSVTGKPLFRAPVGRSWSDFQLESEQHGWPSFRDNEVIGDDTRVLEDGEVVSLDGTHLGHNLPDGKGNRYCINLVSVAGQPPDRRLRETLTLEVTP